MEININHNIKIDTNFYRIENIQYLTSSTFILRIPFKRFSFNPGQYISISIQGDIQSREYSIYSASNVSYLEILIKEVEGGYFSPKLKKLKKGDLIEIQGPFGEFSFDENKLDSHQHIFIASGTGIAPFHSMIKSNPDLDYQLIHGVRYSFEAYEKNEYEKNRYVLCTSKDMKGNFQGRVTEYIKTIEFDKNCVFYLCGNSNMIYDTLDILKEKGVEKFNINREVYF